MFDTARLATEIVEPLLDPASRTFLPSLFVAAVVAAVYHLVRRRSEGWTALRSLPRFLFPRKVWLHRSSILDVQVLILRRLLAVLGLVPVFGSAWWIATSLVRALDRAFGIPELPELPAWAPPVVYTVGVFVAWDASRFLLHKAMHEIPALWQIHQVHHSAEVLTPLTFHRLHPLESVLYGLRGTIVGGVMAGLFFWLFRDRAVTHTVLGVHALGFLLDAATGNLRHSHVWLRFGDRVERWLLSPAQHQLHHSADPAHYGCNYGTWLAVWDRLCGSLRLSGAEPPSRYGIEDGERNHAPDDLISVLVGPLVGMVRSLRPARLLGAGALLLVAGRAVAQEADGPAEGEASSPAAPADEEDVPEVVVTPDADLPKVPGSVHLVTEEELERAEYDDVHRVLVAVPGVYVRGEDGFGLRPNIGIRGANSDRSAKITLMEDGVLLAPAPYAAPAAYYFPMTTRLSGVEVYKGPASIRFGPQTVGGAVNLRTRPVPDDGAAGMLDVAGGLWRTFKAHGWGGYGDETWGVLLEGVHLSSGGFKELDGGGPTGFERQEAMLKVRAGSFAGGARGETRHTLELKGGFARERSNETYLGLSRADFERTPYRRYAASARDLMRWRRGQAELAWRVEGADFDVHTVAYYHTLSRQWTKLNRFASGPDLHALLLAPEVGQAALWLDILRGVEDSATPDQVLRIGTNDRRFHSFGVQSAARWRAGNDLVTSQLEIGARLHGDIVRRLHTEDPFDMRSGVLVPTGDPTITTLDSRATALAFAGHVQEDLGIGPVRLTPGVRVEVFRTTLENEGAEPAPDVTRVMPLPGMGVLVQATPWMHVFGGAHRGFSPPAPGAPPEVRPESSWNYEAGLRVGTAGGTRADLIGFFDDYANLTGQCTLSSGCTEDQLDDQFSAGRVWVYGIEALVGQAVRLPHEIELAGQLTYTWTGSSFREAFLSSFSQFGRVEAGDELPYVPEHQGSVRLVLAHPRASLSVAGVLRGAMRDVAGQGEIRETERIPTAFLLDLAAHVQITGPVEAYVTVNNATNAVILESYRPYGSRPAAPITAMFGVKVRGHRPNGG